MEVKAVGKYIRVSPTKIRDIARQIKGKNALETMAVLRVSPKSGARALSKVLGSAIANAENNNDLKKEGLNVLEAIVNEGPKLKRFQPRAKGATSPILKRTSHLTVVVTGEEKLRKIKKTQEETETQMKVDMPKEEKIMKKEAPKKIKEEKVEAVKAEAKTDEVKEVQKEAEEKVNVKEGKVNIKDLAKDRVKKNTVKGVKNKEEGFKADKSSGHEKEGLWNRFFRRKTG